ncbi:MAG TPA: tetratricopeptide repeat protein, partial [Terriglobales bacterium]|nr:tetratricopeptide repeat protein [Terriglobales bacterium]
EYEWSSAEREFRRALELNPNLGNVHNWYGLMLSWIGRHDEAIAQLKQALELDPLNLKYNDTLAIVYSNAGKYDLAFEQWKKTLEMDPNFPSSLGNMAGTYLDVGRYEEWLQGWVRSATAIDDKDQLKIAQETARVYHQSGRTAALKRTAQLWEELGKRRYVDPAQIAYNYAYLGDGDRTFQWLEKAYQEKSNNLGAIKIVVPMNQFHSDPRYVDLLKRMHLTP